MPRKKAQKAGTVPPVTWDMLKEKIAHSEDVEEFKTFLDQHNIDPNIKWKENADDPGRWILPEAAGYRRADIVEYLVDMKGVDVNQGQNEGLTALHYAIYEEQFEIVDYLLNKGANVNATDDEGVTPLMAAMLWPDAYTIKSLLRHGADKSLRNVHGDSAYDYLMKFNRKNKAIKNLLIGKDKITYDELYNTLKRTEPIYKVTKNTEFIGRDMMGVDDEKIKQRGKYFFDTENVRPVKEVIRVYDERILDHIKEGKIKNNPFTRRPWSIETLDEFRQTPVSTLEGGQQKQYHTYDGRRYVVRTGSRGGKYILAKKRKFYI